MSSQQRKQQPCTTSITQSSHIRTLFVSVLVRAGEITIDENLTDIGECIAYNSMSNRWIPLDCNTQKQFTCDASKYEQNNQSIATMVMNSS